MRDQLYNFVYTEGDFALQMVGDLFRGYEPQRENKHLERQITLRKTRVTTPNTKSASTTQKHSKPERPLSQKHHAAFINILKRETGEGQIEYWKRKKWMLALPNGAVLEMIHRREELQKQADTQSIQVDASNITQSYQQRLAEREERKRMKERVAKRYRKRGR